MHRYVSTLVLAALAGAMLVAPAMAGDSDGLREELRQLQREVGALEEQSSRLLEQEINSYLDESDAWRGSQGGGLDAITVHARFTAVSQSTIGLDLANRSVVNGDVDLDFDFQVTDNLDLFIYMTANDGTPGSPLGTNAGFPSQWGPVSVGFPPEAFPAIAGSTFQGLADGIGVNGTVPTDPGSITVHEAGIYHRLQIGETILHWEGGDLDPRRRFMQNAYADDENTQFIHNGLDDSAAVLWLSDSSGRTVLGLHMWINFGEDDQFTLSWGFFNTPGQFFNRGQFMIQLAWRTELNGREMNLRVMGFMDEFNRNAAGDGDAGAGVSWDWLATDRIGLFVKIGVNGEDVNPVEFDAAFGAQFRGLLDSRPDDVLGVGVILTSANDAVLVGIPEDTEFTLEVYYRYMAEDGKLQITPHLLIVTDPGGNAAPWADDTLIIAGVRLYVPF
jgi:hypothetical protein